MGRGIPRAFLSGKRGGRGEGDDLHGYRHWTRMMCGVVDGMCDVIRGYYGRRLDWLVLIGSCNSRVVLVYYLMGGEFDGTCFTSFLCVMRRYVTFRVVLLMIFYLWVARVIMPPASQNKGFA